MDDVNPVCRCLLAVLVAGIVACGGDEKPAAGPDLTLPALVVLTPDSLRLQYNETGQVSVTVLNAVGDTLTNATVSYRSEDTTVASVDQTGSVHARAEGSAYIEVTSGGVHAWLLVRVRVNGTLSVTPPVSLITSTDTLQLTVVVKDSTGAVVANPVIEYRSPDTAIARVLTSGTVVFGGSAGTVSITVASEGRTSAVFVTAVVARMRGVGPLFALNAAGDLLGQDTGYAPYFTRLRLPDAVALGVVQEAVFGVGTVAIDAAAHRAYIGDDYFGTLTVLDPIADTLMYRVSATHQPYQPRPPYALVVAPNGALYFNADSLMQRLDVDAFTPTPLFQFGRAYHAVLRDTLLYVSGDSDIREFNVRTGALGRTFGATRYAYDLALNAQGTRLYYTSTDFPLRIGVRDLATGDTLPSLSFLGYGGVGDPRYTSLAIQPGTGLLWIITHSQRVLIVDPNTRQIVRELRPGGYPQGIAFAASGVGALGNGKGWIDFVR